MKKAAPVRSILFGDVVALAFDIAQGITPNPRLAALLAAIAVDQLIQTHPHPHRRAAPRSAA